MSQRKAGAGAAAKREVLEATGWRADAATAEVQADGARSRRTLQEVAQSSDAVAARAAKEEAQRLRNTALQAVQRQVNNHVRQQLTCTCKFALGRTVCLLLSVACNLLACSQIASMTRASRVEAAGVSAGRLA